MRRQHGWLLGVNLVYDEHKAKRDVVPIQECTYVDPLFYVHFTGHAFKRLLKWTAPRLNKPQGVSLLKAHPTFGEYG